MPLWPMLPVSLRLPPLMDARHPEIELAGAARAASAKEHVLLRRLPLRIRFFIVVFRGG